MLQTSKQAALILLFVSIIGTIHVNAISDLKDVLHSYETIHSRDVSHHVSKRSMPGVEHDKEERHVMFKAFDREFQMTLKKSNQVFAPGFKVLSVDKFDKTKEVHVNTDMYTGTLQDDQDSDIHAYFEEGEESRHLVATVQTKSDVYVVEPSWRHLPESDDYDLIAYKESDMKLNDTLGPSYCGFVRPDGDAASYDNIDQQVEDAILHSHSVSESPSDRYKRQTNTFTPPLNTCPLLLVADYRFYKDMGQSSLSKTTTYLISLIDRVNNIYRQTTWGNGYTGVGFGIKEIHIHEEWSYVSGNDDHYNKNVDTWETKKLLEVFSQSDRHHAFCLSHLFTSLNFEDGSLGLSYVASPLSHNPGGLCSPAYYKDNHQLYLNTGWSSSLNRYNRKLLTQEALLVTTHEFGHNWGSEHDPDTNDCSPNAFKGGKYIMYTYSVSGYDTNNKMFSPCSMRSIGSVLAAKSHKCFTAPIDKLCGNSLREEGEECDPGPLSAGVDGDRCCSRDCELKRSAYQCSDMNDECCSGCKFSVVGTVCHPSQNGSCEDTAKCTGLSASCPTPPYKADGSECIGKGQCKAGECIPYCESNNMISCACDDVSSACMWCCRAKMDDDSRPDKNCTPVVGAGNLPNGMPCIQGYCQDGVCEKQVQDLVQRFWDIIEQLDPSRIVAFMKANIVGTVIILSLFLWIPASCIVCYVDRKNKRRDENERAWLDSSNNTLVAADDAARVRRTNQIHPRRREFTMASRDTVVRPRTTNLHSNPPAYRTVANQPTSFI